MFGRSLRDRSFRPCVQAQAANDIMQKVRKMAGAFFIVQWNMRQGRLPFYAYKPFINYSLKFAFKDVRHALNRDCTDAPVDTSYTFYCFRHCSLLYLSL